MIIRKHVRIGISPELVWDVITDLRRAKEWAPGFEEYPYISANWPKEGATAVWRSHSGPLRFAFSLVMKKSERGQALHIANRSAFGTGMEIYRFECAGRETTVDYEASSEPNILGRLFAAVMTRKLEKQMDQPITNLKRYCEAEQSNGSEQISL